MLTSDSSPPRATIPVAVADAARGWGGEDVRVDLLAGDASTRMYYRATTGGASGHSGDAAAETVIIALHDSSFHAVEFPFLQTTDLFMTAGVPVPRILSRQPAAGILILEDLGDRLLQHVLMAKGPAGVVATLYKRAVDHIVRLQQHGTPRLNPNLQAGRLALDAERFRFELDYFFTHVVLGLHGVKPTDRQRGAVEAAFERLCTRLDREPRVLCHRDYHTRNLLVTADGRLVAIDHQDARRGPDTYDLASLLYDPYVDLQVSRTRECIRQFRQARGLKEPATVFGERLDAVAAQRLLKAAGTFAAQKVLYGRSSYLAYLPAALTRARAALQRHDTHADLLAALTPLLPEWPG
ncbi:MAG: phosphotransferase [Acidobacteria bacterium]|nr:phosphotransferase [Acidobacteriota bacterium]